MVAVPVPDPTDSRHAAARVAAVIRDCSASLVLTVPGQVAVFAAWLEAEDLGWFPCEGVAPLDPHRAGSPDRLPTITDESLAVLQYSSGSTGEAKGVMLTHARYPVQC